MRARRRSAGPGPNRGLTLVEVLVAITLFVMILAAVYGAFRGITNAGRRAEAVTEVSQSARVILSDIAGRLGNFYPLYPPPPIEADGAPPRASTAPAELNLDGRAAQPGSHPPAEASLSFINLSAPLRGETRAVMRVRYSLETTGRASQRGGSDRVLVRATQPVAEAGAEAFPTSRTVLTDRAESLEFRYLHPKGGSWHTSWRDPSGPPALVRIELALRAGGDGRRVERFSRVVALPAVTPLSELPESRAPLPVGVDAENEEPAAPGDPGGPQKPGDLGPGRPPRTPHRLPDGGEQTPPADRSPSDLPR